MEVMIDTSFERNVAHVRPYLGVALIAVFAIFLFMKIYSATSDLTQVIHTNAPEGVEGSIKLVSRGQVVFGDTIEYRTTASGIYSTKSNTYVTTVCFQGENMVYQMSAQQGVDFYMYDQMGSALEWDGGDASCSATLMYREVTGDTINVYVVDSISFEVKSRGY